MSADLAAILTDPAADPVAVIAACQLAAARLRPLVTRGLIDDVGELRAQAAALSQHVRRTGLDKDVRLAADELCRRAERGLG